jgi:hypothetical protein
MRKALLAGIFGVAAVLPATSVAYSWTASQLPQLTSAFVKGVSGRYNSTQYPWQFLDPADCFNAGVVCFFSNPDGPYGYPLSSNGIGLGSFMKAGDAIVMIMETPPTMTYFGITPYLYTRYYANPPLPGGQTGTSIIFESIDDSINMNTIRTAGSKTAGTNVFTQLSVVVMTADQTTYKQVVKVFTALGFPSSAINLIAMPINAVPLHMGNAPIDDTFTVLMRLAYPQSLSAMADYIQRAPLSFLQLTPTGRHTSVAEPTPVSRVPGDGVSEPSSLQAARDQLVQQLTAQYAANYTIKEIAPVVTQTQNYVCIWSEINCNVDNSDAVYTHEANAYVPASQQDQILIVGVNHVDTGKATYVSHSVINDLYHVGVFGINNVQLEGSALTMAGITSADDPRYATYKDLYAFTISYDCTGQAVCYTIPQSTPTNPVGVPFGTPLDTSTRFYVDPATNTRPSVNELILHRTFLLTKK